MGVRTGEENKGQQDLDLSSVWSLPRPFSWTSDLYSLFSFSSLYAGPKSKASLGISPTPSCCVDIDPLSKLHHVPPLLKILRMSTHLPPWPSPQLHLFPRPLPLAHNGSSPGFCLYCTLYQINALPSDVHTAGIVISFRSLLSDPAHFAPMVFTSPSPAPHGEDLCLFCSPLFLQNLEKWPICSRGSIRIC